MAVEAQHLHLFSHQPLLKSTTTTTSREYFLDNQHMYNAAPMGAFVDAPIAASTSYVVPSESGLTTDVVIDAANGVPRKRPWGNLDSNPSRVRHQTVDIDRLVVQHDDDTANGVPRKRIWGNLDSNPSRVRHQMVDIDRLIVQHDEKVRAEVMERRRFAKQMVAVVEERVSKRLRAKDEEIEQMSKLNWAMEEKMKRLAAENQVWRYLAQTNEAAANALRTSLEQVLAEQLARAEEEQNILASAAAAADDAESCCGDNFDNDRNEADATAVATTTGGSDWRKLCRGCCADEPSVLLIPCQHLCLCATCAPTTNSCPICKCCKTGSVYVNLSQ